MRIEDTLSELYFSFLPEHLRKDLEKCPREIRNTFHALMHMTAGIMVGTAAIPEIVKNLRTKHPQYHVYSNDEPTATCLYCDKKRSEAMKESENEN